MGVVQPHQSTVKISTVLTACSQHSCELVHPCIHYFLHPAVLHPTPGICGYLQLTLLLQLILLFLLQQVPANAQLPAHYSTASGAQATCSSGMTERRQHARAAAPPQAAVAPGSTAEPSTSQSVDWFATDKRPVILFDGVCNL